MFYAHNQTLETFLVVTTVALWVIFWYDNNLDPESCFRMTGTFIL